MLHSTHLAALAEVDLIISVGSVDGVCTTAALLRLIGGTDVEVCFTQAFTVDKIDVSKWAAGQKVAFVDLAVNNRDKAMTAAFIQRIREAGHEIVAVIDEHNADDWYSVLGTLDGLVIEPRSQYADPEAPKSSGEVLRRALMTAGMEPDALMSVLLHDADAGDYMDFTTRIGGVVNKAVKSAIADDSRRVYLAKHFAWNCDPDWKINGWIEEYDQILSDHEDILAAEVDLGGGIVRVLTIGKKVDMTTLMATLYASGTKVVVCEGEMFDKAKGCKTRQIAFGTNIKSLDLLTLVKSVVPSASGFAQKVNVMPEHEAVALAAVRSALA